MMPTIPGPIIACLVAFGLAHPTTVLAQDPGGAAYDEGPADVLVLQQVLPSLAGWFDRILPRTSSPRRILVNPTVRRHQSRGGRTDTISLEVGGATATLPLRARLAHQDCGELDSLFECGLNVGDAIVHIGNGSMKGERWIVLVAVLGPLTDSGGIAGASFSATFQRQGGGWQFVELDPAGVF